MFRCLIEILKLKFDQVLCKNLCHMNSTLGSVVPLAMFPSNTLIYGISRDGSKNINIRTCEQLIFGQLTMGARQAKNAPLNIGMKCNGYLQQKSSHAPHPHTLPHTLPVPRLVPSAPSKQFQLPISWRSQACRILFCIFMYVNLWFILFSLD